MADGTRDARVSVTSRRDVAPTVLGDDEAGAVGGPRGIPNDPSDVSASDSTRTGHPSSSVPQGSSTTRKRSLTPPPDAEGVVVEAKRAGIYATMLFELLQQGEGVGDADHENGAALAAIQARVPVHDKEPWRQQDIVDDIFTLYLGMKNTRGNLQEYKMRRMWTLREDEDQHYNGIESCSPPAAATPALPRDVQIVPEMMGTKLQPRGITHTGILSTKALLNVKKEAQEELELNGR